MTTSEHGSPANWDHAASESPGAGVSVPGAAILPAPYVTGNLRDLPPVPQRRVDQLVRSLKEICQRAWTVAPSVSGSIDRQLALLGQGNVVITFGGHFKSGKSTVINAALHRLIMPMDDLPETGAICVLTFGKVDSAIVHNDGDTRPIECSTECIRRETSLISSAGERRGEVHSIEQLDITLADCVIPESARWIDSPGINDTAEMDQRALQAARAADTLIWVTSSRQPLSEVEMDFLADYVAQRGPASVVFLVNAFLQKDELDEWKAFLSDKMPRVIGKIHANAQAMGFPSPPLVIPAAGRALCGTEAPGFGRRDLRQFLTSFNSNTHPRVQRARLYQTALELRSLESTVRQRVASETESLARRAAAAKQRQARERRRADFAREIESAAEAFLADWGARARQTGAALAATITAPSLQRGLTYSETLSRELKAAADGVVTGLLDRVQRLAEEYNQPPIDDLALAELRALLTPPDVIVMVPLSGKGKVTSTMPQSVIAEFIENDAHWARWNTSYATEQAVAALTMKEQKILACALGRPASTVTPDNGGARETPSDSSSADSGFDQAQVDQLEEIASRLTYAADLAVSLAELEGQP